MAGKIDNRTLETQIAVPKGESGIWAAMKDRNQFGDWTVADVDGDCCVSDATIRQYLRRLVACGIAQCVDAGVPGKQPPSAKRYRLNQTPYEAPRFNNDGKLLGERSSDTIWRAAKMLDRFTVAELHAQINHAVTQSTLDRYVRAWTDAGVLRRSRNKGTDHYQYQVRTNIGRSGPRILRGHVVYDPNAHQILASGSFSEGRS